MIDREAEGSDSLEVRMLSIACIPCIDGECRALCLCTQ